MALIDKFQKIEREEIVQPMGNLNFGPYAAYFKIPQNFREGLLRKGKELEPGSANKKLVGLIGDQRSYTKEDREWFIKKFQPYLTEYVHGKCKFDGQPFDPNNPSTSFTLSNLSFFDLTLFSVSKNDS